METPSSNTQERQASEELKIESFGSTIPSIKHPGFNEDAIGHSPAKKLAIICDGFSDSGLGMRASNVARKTIAEGGTLIREDSVAVVKSGVQDLLVEASNVVGREVPGGETGVIFVKFFNGNERVVVGNIGNSRAYLFRNGSLFQMTVDDNAASKNKLLGGGLVTPEVNAFGVQDGDQIIITSSGVHSNLTKVELQRIIATTPAEKLADRLTSTAARRSGQQSSLSGPADASAIVIRLSTLNEHAKSVKEEDQEITRIEQDFKGFLKKHADEIRQRLDSTNGYQQKWISQAAIDTVMAQYLQINLANLWQGHFLAISDLVHKQYYGRRDDPQVINTAAGTELVRLIRTQGIRIQNLEETNPNIYISPDFEDPGWLFALNKSKRSVAEMSSHEGVPSVETGRFYINIKPEYAVQAFIFLAQEFVRQGKRFDLKTYNPDKLRDPDQLNRRDGMVLYFHQADFKDAVELLRKFAEQFPDALNPTRPRFTAGLVDKTGKQIPGIGFGQEPDNASSLNKKKSFGRLRADILAEVVTLAHQTGFDPTDPRFDFRKALMDSAQKRDVSLKNLAFNEFKGEQFRQLTKGYLN